ncbi:MAG: ATP-binding protein [Minicystis sp.]
MPARAAKLELMDGGIHALKGFIYQATVILDVLLQCFETYPGAEARPEGTDDLELVWGEHGNQRREYIQIKKPSEDDHGRLKREPWNLRKVAQVLLPGAINHLRGNDHLQRWILGDDVDPEVRLMVKAGADAASLALGAYLHVVHLLAREASGVTEDLSTRDKKSVGHWRFNLDPDVGPEDACARMVAAFRRRAAGLGASERKIRRYEEIAREHWRELGSVLSRIRIESTFGHDDEVRARVCACIAQTYPISRERVSHTVFGNMRAFVDDVAVRRGEWIDRDALDALVVRAWPEMMVLREPPPLPEPYIERRELVAKILGAMPCRALEIVGVAGSGKTSLARAVHDQVKRTLPDVDAIYAEVHRDRTLREVLAAVGFHLRKRGGSALRDVAERTGITEEERVREAARALHEVSSKTLILVDLVQGDCDDELARLLSIFLLAGPPERCTVAIFGQESALRALTPMERQLAGIPARIEQRGFRPDEFETLVRTFHPHLDRERLWGVYQRAAAGRVAGLFARLAYDLARAPSIEVMERIVAGPPEQIVPRALRDRFERVAPALRAAAEKLVCMLLPFRPKEAVEIFPEDRIKAAIDQLAELGLLHHHDHERLEMHETVRRSLESDVPHTRRAEAHGALAAWYGRQGKLLAEIHHLDGAGQQEAAHRRARDAFFAGDHDHALMDYVARNRLIAPAELADAMLRETLPERAYLMPDLFRRLGDGETADTLLAGLQAQAERFDTDYSWAQWMVGSVLACDPGRLYDLARFALAGPHGKDGRQPGRRIKYVAQGARLGEARVDERVLALFDSQEDAVKWKMLTVLLLDPRREVLQKALSFVQDHEPQGEPGSYVVRRGPPVLLTLRSREEIIAFLGALPLADTSAMIIDRAPRFGRLTELVWAMREQLQSVCIELLQSEQEDDAVLENALRVLILFGDRRVVTLCQKYQGRKSRFGTLAALIHLLFPQEANTSERADRVLDLSQNINERVADFRILSVVGDPQGSLLQAVQVADPEHARGYRLLSLTAQILRPPREESVPLLDEALRECRDDKQATILGPLLQKIGELPGEHVTDLIVRALSHATPKIRFCACMALQSRRSRRALAPLRALLAQENDPTIGKAGIVALVASGPEAIDGAATFWSRWPEMMSWRCILLGRLRSQAEAGLLVGAATDPRNGWQLRRAAILAASRLPFDLALGPIVEPVMREWSPFKLDQSYTLLGHQALCAIFGMELNEEQSRLLATHGLFVLEVWFDVFVKNASLASPPPGTPDGRAAAEWVASSVSRQGHPTAKTLKSLINELHVPILHAALLRGLRMAGQYQRIEDVIRTADSPWLLVRACSEYAKGRDLDSRVAPRLSALIANSRFPENPFARNLANNVQKRADRAMLFPRAKAVPQAQDTPKPMPAVLSAEDVVAAVEKGEIPGAPHFLISCPDESQMRRLAVLLDPTNDYVTESVSVEPSISFIEGGVTVSGVQQHQRDNHAQARAALRPAVAAANRFGVPIAWHGRSLSDTQYFTSFLQQLGAGRDADRFYNELAEHADVIMGKFDDAARLEPIRKLLDVRIVPYLQRYVRVGTDGLLATLCCMAREVDDPVVDPVLAELFQRWCRRFDLTGKPSPHDMNIPLWNAFGNLLAHPRFRLIQGYEFRLVELISVPMLWLPKASILRALVDAPRSYAHLEGTLFRSAPFEHGPEDQVDHLDAAADALFHRLVDV